MYSFETNISADVYDAFVESHIYCNLLQSSDWAAVKENWKSERVGVREDGCLKAAALVLIKPLPMKQTMVYIPRGPVMDYTDKELVKFFFENLKKWSKKYHALYIKIDPGFKYSEYHVGEDVLEDPVYGEALKNLEGIGFEYQGLTQNLHDTIQPRHNMTCFKEEFDIENFTKKGKKNINTARKKHLITEICGRDGLDDFVEIMDSTSRRKGISLRGKDYFGKLLDIYGEKAFIVLTYLDLAATYEDVKERYLATKNDLETCPENAHKKRAKLEETMASVSRDFADLEKEKEEYGDKVCVCGTLTIVYGKTSEILYAGMRNEFKRYMAPYLTWYLTMEHCFDLGCEMSNMGGVEGSLKGGLSDYKIVFHPRVVEFAGEFDLPVNKLLYGPAKWAYAKFRAKHA